MTVNLSAKAEALLFAAGDDGLTAKQLAFLTSSEPGEVIRALSELENAYRSTGRGIRLKEMAGVFQLVTKEDVADVIRKLVENPTVQSLSQASLEVLAIIAYKQPVTRVEIEDLRGVKSEKPLSTLSAKGLVHEVGRAEGAGRAILYGTTKEFLNYFGLKDLKELPPLPEEHEEDADADSALFSTGFRENAQSGV
ncbi:SMC-Scp complex subunit ScpB [Planococcus lenghuensis]|uniref:Segregation and condensation protein B n=1 Tax=Planococcus lenghuensis TaxID=2213202 RepID=A0A1Q2KZM9_9BACL|nr:SMC-Scp complex subunit ScpB [Planococcus lenghuensis]AQQ53658.1 SMC-Scp complex subunit ScpB [Planococcus lenghuensis]